MNKISLWSVLVLIAMLMVGPVSAGVGDNVVVDVSSFVVTGNSYEYNNNPLALSSATFIQAHIVKATISNDDSTVAQTITLWDGWDVGNSTANVTKIWEVHLDAEGTTQTQVVQEVFSDRWPLRADYGLAITKSAEGSNVAVSLKFE